VSFFKLKIVENVANLIFFSSLSPSDPPSTPVISGYTEGSVIPAGSSQKLLCMSSGGNPPATLTWFKNDKKVNKA
jgi:nephron